MKEGRGDAKSEAAPPSAKAMSGPSEQNEAGSTGGKQEEVEGQGGTSSGPAPSQATPPSPATGETLMNEVTGLLRSLRIQAGPSMKACQLRRVGSADSGRWLLDGGATHALRPCDDQEWQQGEAVSVVLAHGSVEMKQNTWGTLLTRERVQPILPLVKIAALGFNITWDASGCAVTHPVSGSLDIVMEQGCPTVSACDGQWLLTQIEGSQARLRKIEKVIDTGKGDGSAEQDRWLTLSKLFPRVPVDLLRRVPGRATWRGECLPFNRRVRRRIERAKYVVVHVFSGKDESFWQQLNSQDVAVLPLDLLHGADLLDPDLGAYLEHLAMSGKIDLWLAGPPCRTTSAARHREDAGPKPLRGRSHDEQFGLPGLSPSQLEQVNADTVLWLKNLWWIWLASKHRPETLPPFETLVEQPRDPAEWKEDGESYPSFTVWEETQAVMKEVGMKTVRLNQGEMGHVTTKPTALLTTLKEVLELDGLCGSKTSAPWPKTVEERLDFSRQLASWAPGLKQLLAKIIGQRSQAAVAAIRRLTKAERDSIAAWQAHFDLNRTPFRNDCSICLTSAGRGRPRRKLSLEHRMSYCLSLDIAGPFQPGVDQAAGPDPRYFLVANLSVPVNAAGPMVEGLKDLGFKLPSPPVAELVEPPRDQLHEDVEQQAEDGQAGDPMEEQGEQEKAEPDLREVAVQERDEAERKWKEFINGASEVESRVLTFALPLVSRKTQHVIPAVASVFARAKSLQIPILRLHSDRAQEFASTAFRRWCLERDLWHTMSPGDEPTQNARVERTIGLLKNQVRTLIRSTKTPMTWWPLALRQAAEQLLRDQLWSMGIYTPRLPPFGCRAVAKTKTWHQRSTPWKFPGCLVRVWGPAHDMSISSGGVFIRDDEGHWMKSTVVRPVWDPPVDEHGQVIEDESKESLIPGDDLNVAVVAPSPKNEVMVEVLEETPATSSPLVAKKRYRLSGKQTVDNTLWVPTLAALRAGRGEVSHDGVFKRGHYGISAEEISMQFEKDGGAEQVPNSRCGGSSPTTGSQSPHGSKDLEQQWLEGVKLVQHKMLKEMVNEEGAKFQAGDADALEAEVWQQVHETIKNLEYELEELKRLRPRMRSIQTLENGEVLQTQTVSLEEVKKDLQAWIPAFKLEVETILESGAMERIDEARYRQLLQEHPNLEKLPMMAVATVKPPRKLKGRVVVCGNQSTKQPQEGEPDPSVGGADTIAIRCLLDVAVQRRLCLGSIDVKGAFLQAPRRSVALRPTVCDPPNLLKQMQLVGPQEKWLVHKALYGFQESPSDWSHFRDTTMRQLAWQSGDLHLCLRQTAEKHLWKVCEVGNEEKNYGYIAVYVDDLLFAITKEHVDGLTEALQRVWKCSPPEMVSNDKDMRFCGFELRWVEGEGLRISQDGFIREVLKRRAVKGTESTPLPVITDEPDEDPDPIAIRQAQGLVGELTWLTTRSRPDLAYSVGLASRLVHRRPRYVVELCNHILRYLQATVELSMVYRPCKSGDMGKQDELQVPKSLNSLQVFADASYAPAHERFRSISGIAVEHAGCLLAWDAQAQPFITNSTAEAEVISYNSACQIAESVDCLLTEFGYPTSKRIYGDSKAGISVISADCGPWRTRHLRIRSWRLRELVQTESSPWTIRHMSGELLVADGLTKSLQKQAFQRFVDKLSMEFPKERPAVRRFWGENQVEENNRLGLWRTVAIVASVGSLLWLSGETSVGLAMLASVAAVAAGWMGTKPTKANEQRPHKMANKNWEEGHTTPQGIEGWSGTAPKSGDGTTSKGDPRDHGSLDSLDTPKIRAFRLPRSSHGDGAESASSSAAELPRRRRNDAAARGQAALRSQENLVQAMDGLHISTSVTVNISGMGAHETGGHEAASIPTVPRPPRSWRTANYEANSSSTMGGEVENEDDTPWFDDVFAEPPRGADQWRVSYISRGWLIRTHGSKGRVKPFHPIHRSNPVNASDLEGTRVTLLFGPSGGREILRDQWTQPRTWQRPGPWKGFTFLKMKSTSMRNCGASSQSLVRDESPGSSTHSYELVTAG